MFWFVLMVVVVVAQGKPSFGSFSKAWSRGGDTSKLLKIYSGWRADRDSMRMVYFNDQTIAVVELGPGKLLLGCEVIEVFETDQYSKVLGELQSTAKPVGISFLEMITLMDQCKELDEMNGVIKEPPPQNKTTRAIDQARSILANDPFTILKGIVPGTKWCGTGDIARNYFDLGVESSVDACCRTHDLCPVKVRARTQRYNLENNSLYTKSHCECDQRLFDCLKKQQFIPVANLLGNIYFNVARVQCVDDAKEGRVFRSPARRF
ncbi:hypothetical protein GWI33_005136 [Rhynchophorus ferrugineus]|uniref:phospholipase A2 n=1 Tax=Rhynchophorus ferrugineus TaxID=354439 RepID=A0A834MMV3_RHYFE|nr:hypothetical protein GWI33_005136 [Rhynchophorus ferrugineus]